MEAWASEWQAPDADAEMQWEVSSQSSAMSICMSIDTPPASPSPTLSLRSTTVSEKSTCLKRKKKSRSGGDGRGDDEWSVNLNTIEDDVTKRLDFDDLELSGASDELEKKTESAKKRKEKLKAELVKVRKQKVIAGVTKKSRRSSVETPYRNTCILESPLDHRKTTRKHRIYGVRRNEPQLVRKHPKRSAVRPMPFALCSLQRMFAE